MVARSAIRVDLPKVVLRGPIFREFHMPLMRGDWGQFKREVMVEGGTGTGKTFSLGRYFRNKLRMFPGMHLLVLRRFKADLPGSWMQTWEEEVLEPGDPWDEFMLEGPSREQRGSYSYPNGSTIWLRGMDQWARMKSAAFDDIWAVEGTELAEEQIQGLHTRIRPRRGVHVPFRQMVFDVNPGPPGHWMNKRALRGVTHRITTTIKHNPGYWDAQRNRPSAEGGEYIERLLSQLDGHQLRRLWYCEWCAATGMILENFNANVHTFQGSLFEVEDDLDELVIGEHPVLPSVVRIGWYVASMDWGRRHAGTLQVWAVDELGRQFLIEEYYHANRSIIWWADVAADVARRYRAGRTGCTLKAIVCDNAWPDNITLFNDLLSNKLGAEAAIAVPCKKATRGESASNLEVLRSSFEGRGSTPDIFIARNSLRHAADTSLVCRRLLDEIPAWCYAPFDEGRARSRPKDEPDPAAVDDGLDAATYARVYIVGGRKNFTPKISKWTPPNPYAADKVHEHIGWAMRPEGMTS